MVCVGSCSSVLYYGVGNKKSLQQTFKKEFMWNCGVP